MIQTNSQYTRGAESLADVHNQGDQRQIAIDNVGVSDVKFPITTLDRQGDVKNSIALVSMAVDLAHDQKGTHMSRFIEVLNEFSQHYSTASLPDLLLLMHDRLKAQSAKVDLSFPLFLSRVAPVSASNALLDYQCKISGVSDSGGVSTSMAVTVPATSLCPCSKLISDYGAHNQRSNITIEVESTGSDTRIVHLEDLIDIAESSASAPVYPLLKRIDERYVTMQAYDNPMFVEDLIRGVSSKLMEDKRIDRFYVQAENFESIHNHNAFASLSWSR